MALWICAWVLWVVYLYQFYMEKLVSVSVGNVVKLNVLSCPYIYLARSYIKILRTGLKGQYSNSWNGIEI